MARVMISCGEPSGDLYAAALTTELRRLNPGGEIFGLGGERLRAAGASLVAEYRGITVTGLTEALRVVPRSLRLIRHLLDAARERRPDVLVVIDFPDFNFRLATRVARLGIPVVYYVPPQIWAWRGGRIRTIRRVASRVLVIFPFEEALYRRAGVPVEFVGHPLLDLAGPQTGRAELHGALGLDASAPTVALLPGSRPNEVRALLPVLVESAALIRAKVPRVQFILARAPNLETGLFAPLAAVRPAPAVVEGRADDVLDASDVVLACSGTATVQAAIHGRPMVVLYRVSSLSYRLGKPFVHLDTYGMVNLVAGRRVVPELIQDGLQPAAVAAEATSFLSDAARAAATRVALEDVKRRLGAPGASRRAAEAVLQVAAGASVARQG